MGKPVYALVGADIFLQLEALAAIIKGLGGDAQRIDVDGERAELSEVLDEVRSFAMFGGNKLVVVRDADEFCGRFKEQMEKYLEHPAESSTLILRFTTLASNTRIYKLIGKNGEIRNCTPPNEYSLKPWVMTRSKSPHKITLAPDAADRLIELIGADLGRLDNELAKLAILTDSGKVTVEQVTSIVAYQSDQDMWDMTDELSMGKITLALQRWRNMVQMDPSNEYKAVGWLAGWIDSMRKALAMQRDGINPLTRHKELRLFNTQVQQPFLRLVAKLGDRGIARAVNLLAQVDLQSKTGVGDAVENVERFILDLAAMIGPAGAPQRPAAR